jgi:hypothetical protein
MDFEEIWSEHKTFILMVGIGLIALLVFQGVKTAVYSDGTVTAVGDARRDRNNLRRETVAKRGDIRELEEQESALQERLTALKTSLELRTPEGYELPDANVKSTFTRVVQETRDKVADVASMKAVRVPYELGVPSITPNTRDEMARYLRGLHVVERVVTYAVEEGVRRFETIEVKPARTQGFLRETKIIFRLSGEGSILAALVDRILDPADPLVLTQFSVTHPPRGGGIIATLGVSILEIDLEKPIGEEGV